MMVFPVLGAPPTMYSTSPPCFSITRVTHVANLPFRLARPFADRPLTESEKPTYHSSPSSRQPGALPGMRRPAPVPWAGRKGRWREHMGSGRIVHQARRNPRHCSGAPALPQVRLSPGLPGQITASRADRVPTCQSD